MNSINDSLKCCRKFLTFIYKVVLNGTLIIGHFCDEFFPFYQVGEKLTLNCQLNRNCRHLKVINSKNKDTQSSH
jgi:hypothetical protein